MVRESSIAEADTTDIEASKRVRGQTKKARLINMLSRKGGGTISTVSATLGWQPHTTRAAITGLRKAGHQIATAKPADGGLGMVYWIVPKSDDLAASSSGSRAAE